MASDYPSYFTGIRHALLSVHPNGTTPWQVLEIAIKRVEPRHRQAVFDAWRIEYPLVTYSKRQKMELREWGVS